MKMKYGLMVAMMISTAVTAQVATNTPPPLPAPGGVPAPAEPAPATPPPVDASVTAATNQPAVKKAKKTAKKKDTKKDVKKPAKVVEAPAFTDNESAVAKQNNINVRGQANINSEVVTHLKQGDAVVVLKEVTLKHPKTDEPAKWAQIALPAGTHVWVNSTFIDTNQTVAATKLNVRTGPGENYSVVGLLHKGDVIKALNVKGDWAEIEAPSNAYAYVAAHLLAPKAPGSSPTTEPVAPPVAPVATVVEPTSPIAPPAAGTPTTTEPTTPIVVPTIPAPLPAPAVEEPPAKRIVQREGIVGGTVSIQAPTHYELESLDDGQPMDYLYSGSTNLVLQHYKGLTVLVSGEEALDERWPNTPVITIQRIQVVK